MSSVAQVAPSVHQHFDVSFSLSLADLQNLQLTSEDALTPIVQRPSLNPAAIYLASLGKGSQRTMRAALTLAAGILSLTRCDANTLPWHHIRLIHLRALRAWLLGNRAPATANKILAAVRGTLRAAWEIDLLSAEDYHRACSVRPIKATTVEQAAGRALTPGEFAALLRVCNQDRSPAGPRDAAILGLGLLGGLRRAEIAAAQLADLCNGNLHLRSKGNKERIVPVHPGILLALQDWLHHRGLEPGPLFYAVNKGGNLVRTRANAQEPGSALLPKFMATASLYDMLQRRAQQAGVTRFSPHDLRRTFAGDLLDAGADIVTVQKLMGHSDPKTTAGYDRRGHRTRVQAISRLHMPWTPQFSDPLTSTQSDPPLALTTKGTNL